MTVLNRRILLRTFIIFFSVLELLKLILCFITCLHFNAMLDPILNANFVLVGVHLDDT